MLWKDFWPFLYICRLSETLAGQSFECAEDLAENEEVYYLLCAETVGSIIALQTTIFCEVHGKTLSW